MRSRPFPGEQVAITKAPFYQPDRQVAVPQHRENSASKLVVVSRLDHQAVLVMPDHVGDTPRPCSHHWKPASKCLEDRQWHTVDNRGIDEYVRRVVHRGHVSRIHSSDKVYVPQAQPYGELPEVSGLAPITGHDQASPRHLLLNHCESL